MTALLPAPVDPAARALAAPEARVGRAAAPRRTTPPTVPPAARPPADPVAPPLADDLDPHARVVRTLRLRRSEIVAVLDPVRSRPDLAEVERVDQELVEATAERLRGHLRPGELVTPTADGRLRLRLLPERRAERSERLQALAHHAIEVVERRDRREDGRPAVLDLGVGWAPVTRTQDAHLAEHLAIAAARESVRQRDLRPRPADSHLRARPARSTGRGTVVPVLLASVGALLAPYLALVGLYAVGLDLSGLLSWVLVASLALSAALVVAEARHARRPQLPSRRAGATPRATAVVTADLPRDAAWVVESVEHLLAQRTNGGRDRVQVVLACTGPCPAPVRDDLDRLAAQHPELVVLEVPDATSRAQGVNAALHVAEGEVIGLFDADHHPMPGAFDRAWAWLGDPVRPADVVQGHCVVRDGEGSALAALAAVDLEHMHAVSQPGRAALHGFGTLSGSAGFWRAAALERIRLRGCYLAEDLEASIRVLAAGGRVASDPGLLSHGRAPRTLRELWQQRVRQARGRLQVSQQHLGPMLGSHELSVRQKLGTAHLLGWRQVHPWATALTWPLLGFLAWRDGGLDLGWPLVLLLALLVAVSGPLQVLAAYRLATPEVRRHPRWFLGAALAQLLLLSAVEGLAARVGHLEQLSGVVAARD